MIEERTTSLTNTLEQEAGVSMTGTLKLKLKGKITATAMVALEKAMLNCTENRDHIAKVSAKNMERAFDIHGLEGLKTQVGHMLNYLGKWHGKEAREVKAALNKFCSNGMFH